MANMEIVTGTDGTISFIHLTQEQCYAGADFLKAIEDATFEWGEDTINGDGFMIRPLAGVDQATHDELAGILQGLGA